MNKTTIMLLLVLFYHHSYSQINTGVVLLNKDEQLRFQKLIEKDQETARIYNNLLSLANAHMMSGAKPIEYIHYEGLLDTNPKRVMSVESLLDANKIVDLIYAGYGNGNIEYGNKIKEMILEWSDTYIATGNPINENKLIPFFWGYHIYKELFNEEEILKVETWMHSIALKEYNRKKTPNNNWQAKRLKIIGLIGGIIQNDNFIQWTIDRIKKYISSSYYPDGSSNDLRTRDALQYHVSGIEPLLDIFINYKNFDSRFDLYSYTDSLGTSLSKSIEFIIPYLSGKKHIKNGFIRKLNLIRIEQQPA